MALPRPTPVSAEQPVIAMPASNPADRTPPHNLDAERAVLGAILLDPAHGGGDEALDKVIDMLRPEDFFRESHAVVYRGLLVLRGSGKPADLFLLIDELERQNQFERIGGDDLLTEILGSIPHGGNVAFHADVVRQKSVSRRLIQTACETIRDGYSNLLTARQLVDRAAAGIDRIAADSAVGVEDALEVRDYPKPLAPEAYHGAIGEMVKRIADYSEASPAAILVQLLAALGNAVGRGPHFVHESNEHRCNLYACVVGNSAYGAKGTSWGYAGHAAVEIDPTWRSRITRGINSGEVLIDQVAENPSGPTDKRLFLLETEFVRLLNVFTREGDSLSVVLRQGWDGDDLATRSRMKTATCSGAHVSVVGHVTPEELNDRLTLTQVANGMGNRFLWVWSVKTEKPNVGRFRWLEVEPQIRDLCAALAHARAEEPEYSSLAMARTASAEELWQSVLPRLSEPQPGLLGKLLARAKPYVMKVAMIFAVFDRRFAIDVCHLRAALAIWWYCVDSVVYVYGDRLGDKNARKILDALAAAGDDGITQNDLKRRVFSGHVSAAKLGELLTRMVQSGLIHRTTDAGKGRTPVTIWRRGHSTPPARSARSARSEIEPPDERPKPIF